MIYDVRRSLSGQNDWTVIATGLSATEYEALKLQAETAYDFQVRAFEGGLYSDWSSIATATTDPIPVDTWVMQGSFAKRSGTGTQVIDGLGVQPKAVLFTSLGMSANGTRDDPSRSFRMFGLTTGPSSSYSIGTAGAGVGTTVANRIDDVAILFCDIGGGQRVAADLQSFDTNGFTLNWTDNQTSNAPDENAIIHYIAFGGGDIDAEIVTWALRTGTGTQQVSGMGFEPTFLFNLHGSASNNAFPSSSTTEGVGFGATDGTSQFAIYSAAFGSTVSRSMRTNMLAMTTNSGGANRVNLDIDSLDADGFTVDVTANNAAYEGMQMVTLGLRGIDAAVGSFQRSTSTTNVISGLEFEPDLLFNASALTTSVATSPDDFTGHSVGISDGSAQVVQSYVYTGGYPWQHQASGVIHAGKSGSSATDETERASLDLDGFTLDYVSGSNAHYIGYVAFAGIPAGGPARLEATTLLELVAEATLEQDHNLRAETILELVAEAEVDTEPDGEVAKLAATTILELVVEATLEQDHNLSAETILELVVTGNLQVDDAAELAATTILELVAEAEIQQTHNLRAETLLELVVTDSGIATEHNLRAETILELVAYEQYMGPGTGLVIGDGRMSTAQVLAMAEEGDTFTGLLPYGGINGRVGTLGILSRRVTDERARPDFEFSFDPLSDPDDVPLQGGGGRVGYRPPVRSDIYRDAKRRRGGG